MELIKLTEMKIEGIDPRYNRPTRRAYGLFKCPICNNNYELPVGRGTNQKSCNNCKSLKHGMSGNKIYGVWVQMIQRCTNPKNKKYNIYGGKGVKVCDKWLTFDGFWEDNKDRYQDGLTIDRKDSNGNYDLDNTRWIPLKQNSSETTKRRPVIQLRQIIVPEKSFEIVKQWESAKQAADELGLVAAHITATCQENRKTHGGFSWKYAN